MSTKKQKAYHKAKRTNSDVDWDAYRTLNNQFTYMQKGGPIIRIGKPNLPKMTILEFLVFCASPTC